MGTVHRLQRDPADFEALRKRFRSVWDINDSGRMMRLELRRHLTRLALAEGSAAAIGELKALIEELEAGR